MLNIFLIKNLFFWILKVLEDVGVICGGDMILEVVFIKLSYVFSKEIWILDKKWKVKDRNSCIYFMELVFRISVIYKYIIEKFRIWNFFYVLIFLKFKCC